MHGIREMENKRMAKYIDADELLKRLNHWKYSMEEPTRRQVTYNAAISDACSAVDAMPAVNIPRWIPVTERLPEKYGQYLVTFVPSGGTLWTKVLIARYSDLMGIAKPSFHIGEVGKNSFTNISEQVIAWMPLPEPYREGEAE